MRRKQSTISKVVALCLTLVMMLSMSMTAMAVKSTDKGSFTVTGFDTDRVPTVTAYQIIKVNVDDASGQPEYPMYSWANASVLGWVQNNYPQYVGEKLGNDAVAEAFNEEIDDATEFYEEMAAAIKGGSINGLTSTTGNVSGGTANFTEMPMGVYLILAEGGIKIYQPTTVAVIPTEAGGVWSIPEIEPRTMKSVDPTITKTVAGDKTVAIGDELTYTLEVTVPSYPIDAKVTTFEIKDNPGSGLDYTEGTLKVYKDNSLTELIPNENDADYTLTESGLENASFNIAFTKEFVNAYTETKLYVTYEATVTDQAFAQETLVNTATLTYSNDPYEYSEATKTDNEQVYTYGIDLTKVDKNGDELTGAEFTLTKSGGNSPIKFAEDNGVYRPATNGSEKLTVSAAQGSEGKLLIKGLDAGTYTLKETKAPDGYVLPTGEITISITDATPDGEIDNGTLAEADGTIKISGNPEVDSTNKNTVVLSVENTSAEDAGFTLPTTGGMGTMIFTIAGILLMGGAVVLIIAVRRKNHQA